MVRFNLSDGESKAGKKRGVLQYKWPEKHLREGDIKQRHEREMGVAI